MAKHGRRAHDSSTRERSTNSVLTKRLGAQEATRRLGVGAQVRDVDEARNTRSLSSLSNTASTVDVDILERKVLCLVVAAGKVDDSVRVTQALVNLLLIAQVPFERDNLAKVTDDTEMTLLVFVAVRHHNLVTLASELAHDVATEEASRTKHGSDSVVGRVAGQHSRTDHHRMDRESQLADQSCA